MVVTDGSGDRATSYQVPLTYRARAFAGGSDGLIGTSEHGVLGRRWIYDGTHDPVLVAQLAALIQGEAEPQAQSVSNTPDRTVTGQPVTNGSLTAIGSVVAANEPAGTDLRVETARETACETAGSSCGSTESSSPPRGLPRSAEQGNHAFPPPGGCLTAHKSAASSPPRSTLTCRRCSRKDL